MMLKRLDEAARNTWATCIKNLLFMHGFGYVWNSQDIGNDALFIKHFKQTDSRLLLTKHGIWMKTMRE